MIEDKLDLDYHIRHAALPKPGGMEELRALIAQPHAVPLDRSPLWKYHFIEGLEGGAFAVYIKVHHSAMDGLAGMRRWAPIGDAKLNNQVFFTLSRLPTDVAEPLPRLAAAQTAGQEAKNLFSDMRDLVTTDISILGAPLVVTGLARLWAGARASNYVWSFFNVVVSNVPGPRQTLYCVGAPAVHYYPVSIPYHGCALNITVQSYLDQLDFGLVACSEAVPDAQRIADFVAEDFAAMRKAELGAAPPGSGRDDRGGAGGGAARLAQTDHARRGQDRTAGRERSRRRARLRSRSMRSARRPDPCCAGSGRLSPRSRRRRARGSRRRRPRGRASAPRRNRAPHYERCPRTRRPVRSGRGRPKPQGRPRAESAANVRRRRNPRRDFMTNPVGDIRPPSALLFTIESRGVLGIARLFAAAPFLAAAPRGAPQPVIDLPGMGGGDGSTMANPSGRGRSAGGAEQIRSLHATTGKLVSLVGWSRGGIIAQEATRLAPEAVRMVLTLGSPFAAPAATNVWSRWRLITGESLLAPSAEKLRRLALPLPVPSTSIYSRMDGAGLPGSRRSAPGERRGSRLAHLGWDLMWPPSGSSPTGSLSRWGRGPRSGRALGSRPFFRTDDAARSEAQRPPRFRDDS